MIPTYTQLIEQAMVELEAQGRNGMMCYGLCYAIKSAEGSFPQDIRDEYKGAYRDAMFHTLLGLLWVYGRRSRTDPSFLNPVPGQKGWKAERMRILRAMKRDFKGM